MATDQTISLMNQTMNATEENQKTTIGSVSKGSDDEFEYKEVSMEDDWPLLEGEENLEATVRAVRHRAAAVSGVRPEAVDYFLRNFLYQAGMTATLECFQAEWAEMTEKGLVDAERVGVVPSVYTENQRLDGALKTARREREECELAASAAAQTLRRVQRARDLHRMQCTRVLQEKHRLVEEMRKLKAQCDSYEPAVKRMSDKCRALLRQTSPGTAEADEAVARGSRQRAAHSAPFCRDPGASAGAALGRHEHRGLLK